MMLHDVTKEGTLHGNRGAIGRCRGVEACQLLGVFDTVQHRLRLIYILTNAFCLWSIIEFFVLTLWFHVVSGSAVKTVWRRPQIVSRTSGAKRCLAELLSGRWPLNLPSDSTLLRHAALAEDGLQNWCAGASDRLLRLNADFACLCVLSSVCASDHPKGICCRESKYRSIYQGDRGEEQLLQVCARAVCLCGWCAMSPLKD